MAITRQQHYVLTGMHCEACVMRIHQALTETPGVSDAAVTLVPPRAIVTMEDSVEVSTLRRSLKTAGDYDLQEVDEQARHDSAKPIQGETVGQPRESLYPLLLIVGFIAGITILVAIRTGSWAVDNLMSTFMAGFFVVFGFFKLLDLRGFTETYRTYDLLARNVQGWAWVYPFVEVGLGAAYLLALAPVATNVITLLLMGVGAIGVAKALLDKRRIRCACLGTVLNLPMTTVTLVEDLGMAAMAGAMLLVRT